MKRPRYTETTIYREVGDEELEITVTGHVNIVKPWSWSAQGCPSSGDWYGSQEVEDITGKVDGAEVELTAAEIEQAETETPCPSGLDSECGMGEVCKKKSANDFVCVAQSRHLMRAFRRNMMGGSTVNAASRFLKRSLRRELRYRIQARHSY